MVRTLRRATILVAATLVLAEGGLRLAPSVHMLANPWRSGAAHRIACVGDSFTYGMGVDPGDAYPEQLQRQLDVRAPGAYSVLNLGVPGLVARELRRRFPAVLQTLHPTTIVVWSSGSGDPVEGELARTAGAGFPADLALARLARVLRFRYRLASGIDSTGKSFGDRVRFFPENGTRAMDFEWDGDVQQFLIPMRGEGDQAAEERARDDYRAMAALAHQAGVGMVLITYPMYLSIYQAWNRAVASAAASSGVPMVDGYEALARVSPAETKTVLMYHPGPAVYREIARGVDAVLTRWGR